MTTAIDYSSDSPPGAAAIKAAGHVGVLRYVTPGRSKSILGAEYRDLADNGVQVGVVYEGGTGDALGGYPAGVTNARAAIGYCAAQGISPRCIYFAVDFDAQPDQYQVVDGYLDGATSILGRNRIGLYAGLGPIEHVAANGKAAFLWQADAWSGGVVSDHAHLFQRIGNVIIGGTECDVNDILQADWGQTGSVPAPADDLLAWCATHPDQFRSILLEVIG